MLLRVLASATKHDRSPLGDRIHPLIALYAPETLPRLEEAIQAGESATEALESLDPEYIEAPERETFNVNTPTTLPAPRSFLNRPRS